MVIYLPGGPGEASIDQFTPDALDPFTVIQTDPRGVGCNSEAETGTRIPDEGFRSEFLASDVLGIIHELKLDHYVLYGISYGTLLGTIVAAKTEQIGNPPQALVLEGVLGSAFKPGESIQGYIDQWNLLKMRVAPAVRTELEKPLPLGKTREEWGMWIMQMLKIGVYPYIGDIFLQLLE